MSLFLAQVIGIYLLVMGVALFSNKKVMLHIVDELFSHKALLFVTGAFTLILGTLLVLSHNVWNLDWTVIITIMAWLTFLKGLAIVLVPGMFKGLTRTIKRGNLYTVESIGALLLGLYLLYQGFFA